MYSFRMNANEEQTQIYTLENSSLTVGPEGLYISIMELDNEDVSVMYRLTNIYGYHYWLKAE